MGLAEIGQIMLSRAQMQSELVAHNVANMSSPGYRSRHAFTLALSLENVAPENQPLATQFVDFSDGNSITTGNPFDLQIMGDGFFTVRHNDNIYYTRNGQFRRDAQGRITTSDGMILQSSSGDVNLASNDLKIEPNGTVIDGGEPVAKLAIAHFSNSSKLRPISGSVFEADIDVTINNLSNPLIQQGQLESSNVSTGTEMIMLMASMRSAESGQKLVQLYDELTGKALSAFGQL